MPLNDYSRKIGLLERCTRVRFFLSFFCFYFFGIDVRLCVSCNHFIPHNKKEEKNKCNNFNDVLCCVFVTKERKKKLTTQILLSLYSIKKNSLSSIRLTILCIYFSIVIFGFLFSSYYGDNTSIDINR